MQALVNDFNSLKRTFGAGGFTQKKKKRRKPKVAMVPNIIKRQESNLSEDSNDPKRRKNVLGAVNPQLLANLNFKAPILEQSINEEAFQSEDISGSGSDKEEEVKLENKNMVEEPVTQKAKTNFFFVHK